MEKCGSSHANGTGSEDGLFTGGNEGLVKEGVLSDEVASAVAAVSDEIGDILKDELDSGRADRIGAELADLSAELGLLAGLADGDQSQDFPSLFEIAVSTNMATIRHLFSSTVFPRCNSRRNTFHIILPVQI